MLEIDNDDDGDNDDVNNADVCCLVAAAETDCFESDKLRCWWGYSLESGAVVNFSF
jgi:hypothetical protein